MDTKLIQAAPQGMRRGVPGAAVALQAVDGGVCVVQCPHASEGPGLVLARGQVEGYQLHPGVDPRLRPLSTGVSPLGKEEIELTPDRARRRRGRTASRRVGQGYHACIRQHLSGPANAVLLARGSGSWRLALYLGHSLMFCDDLMSLNTASDRSSDDDRHQDSEADRPLMLAAGHSVRAVLPTFKFFHHIFRRTVVACVLKR